MAQKQQTQPTRNAFLERSLFWHAKARLRVPPADQPGVDQRIATALPRLSVNGLLYFLPETSYVGNGYRHPREHLVRHRGQEFTYALDQHPYSRNTSTLSFSLPGSHKTLRGAAAIADSAGGQTRTGLVFKIVGDGRVLWTSRPLQAFGARQDFVTPVEGVRRLDLVVECSLENGHAHAAWLDPKLE